MYTFRLSSSLVAIGLLFYRNSMSASAASLTSCPHQNLGQKFDYVIVGGGTAGLVLANRLTEQSGVTVAVIEAGTFPEDVVGNRTQVPEYAGSFDGPDGAAIEWGFTTTPQIGLDNNVFPYYRAKALGGCSTINYMAYSQTSKGAHQRWADVVGDQSYTYDEMLQYYRKTMNFTPPNEKARGANATAQYNPADTVTGGRLGVTYASYAQPWSTWVAKGLTAIGIPKVNAFINGNLIGQSWQLNTITQSDGFRSDSETAYLRPFLSRPNLAIFNGTFAQRILFNRGAVATGVQVTAAGSTCSITANKEVIVSAGVFQSPQLLQVSGVGPAALLQKYNISVVANRPGVGQGMNDHITVPISYRVNVLTSSADENATYLAQAVNQFNTHATGPLASAGGDYLGMEKIPQALRANFSAETVEFLSTLPADWPEVVYGIYPNGVSEAAESVPGADYATLLATLTAPQSRGNVSIASPNMSDAPLINPNLFTEQSDVDVMIAAFKRARQALASKAMAPVLIGQEIIPGPSVDTDEQILAYLKEALNPLYHAFATNKMGNASDPNAVVDSHGKVHGVKNLRVIDCSAFPFLPPGPAPQIQVYILAEKLADDIKNTQY